MDELGNVTMEMHNNITDGWSPALNSTDTEEKMEKVNVTCSQRGRNDTALREEREEEREGGEDGGGEDGGGEDGGREEEDEGGRPRIVGGSLEKQGGSPWQVRETD